MSAASAEAGPGLHGRPDARQHEAGAVLPADAALRPLQSRETHGERVTRCPGAVVRVSDLVPPVEILMLWFRRRCCIRFPSEVPNLAQHFFPAVPVSFYRLSDYLFLCLFFACFVMLCSDGTSFYLRYSAVRNCSTAS